MFNWDDPLAEKPATDKVDNDLLPVSQPRPVSVNCRHQMPKPLMLMTNVWSMDKLISISLLHSNIRGRGITS